MLNITPHTDDSGNMKQHSATEVGDVLKDKGDVVTLENTGTLYEARNLMMRYSISRLIIFQDNRNNLLELLPKKTLCAFYTKAHMAGAWMRSQLMK
jgi:Mg2+/Co2+ transporter CorC